MKNELNTDDLNANNDNGKDSEGIDSIEELWDELVNDDKTEEEAGFVPENKEKAEKMLAEMKDCGCIDSAREMKEKAKKEK